MPATTPFPATTVSCLVSNYFTITRSGLQNLVCLCYSDRALVKFLGSLSSCFIVLQLFNWLADNLHQVLLKSFLLKYQSIFVPYEIWHFRVPLIFLHATFEQPEDVFVVRVLSELELATVVHKLTELLWVSFAQLINSNFQLLLFDVVVFLVLRATGQALPWQTAA